MSERFLEKALPRRNDIAHLLGKRPSGIELWDYIFDWLAKCKNAVPKKNAIGLLAEHGYEGPISEIFSRPFVVVEGTSGAADGSTHIRNAIHLLSDAYGRQFHGAKMIVKEDRNITEEDLKTKSLVLVGNPESNSIWAEMARRLPVKFDTRDLTIGTASYPLKSAFMAITKAPENRQNLILLVGAKDLRNLAYATNINPCKSWFDSCVIEIHGKRLTPKITSKLFNGQAPNKMQ